MPISDILILTKASLPCDTAKPIGCVDNSIYLWYINDKIR